MRASERLGNRTAENRHVGDGSLGWKYETWRKSQELKVAIRGRLRDEEEANLQALRRRIIHSLDSRQIRQPDRSGPDHGRGCCYHSCFEASRSCVAAVMHPFRRAPTRECSSSFAGGDRLSGTAAKIRHRMEARRKREQISGELCQVVAKAPPGISRRWIIDGSLCRKGGFGFAP